MSVSTRFRGCGLIFAVASLPALAQPPKDAVPAASAANPAAAAPTSAATKVVKLPTAADGEVFYRFDAATDLPIAVGDDRAVVTAVALTFLPKKSGEELRWNYLYSLQFSKGAVPKMITVFDEGMAPLKFEVADTKPALDKGGWSASSMPHAVDKKTWDSMIGKDPWVLQRKFVIDYADGTQRTLHALSVVTTTMRLELLEKVTGMKLLEEPKK